MNESCKRPVIPIYPNNNKKYKISLDNCKENNIFFILSIKNILYFLYFYIIFIYYY